MRLRMDGRIDAAEFVSSDPGARNLSARIASEPTRYREPDFLKTEG